MSVETERSSTESSAASGLDFEDTALTLTLRLPGSASSSSSSSPAFPADPDRKRASSDADADRSSPLSAAAASPDAPPAPKARVVGWPPVRSYRKNALADAAGSSKAKQAAKFVKVAVDGAPYLRKVDLEAYASYDQLLRALQDKFFSHFTIREYHCCSPSASFAPGSCSALICSVWLSVPADEGGFWFSWMPRREVRRRREEAGGRSERDGVRAHVRGQGRRLDARRRRPLEDVCGNLPAPSSDEKFRGC
ncbi:unnamed protein product [Urochloa decumbens]|uniref:Auxin-responsive protein n=1 Tax=Urochloa decumbens TaxID=240449 RepID=A0ABC9AIU3_9POAL